MESKSKYKTLLYKSKFGISSRPKKIKTTANMISNTYYSLLFRVIYS